MSSNKATVRDVLLHVNETGLMTLDPRLAAYAGLPLPEPAEEGDGDDEKAEEDDEAASIEITAIDRYLACTAHQFRGYRHYIQQLSPLSTQQGIKGAEFERVLVVLDDNEGTHVQFSYDKYFGVKPLSKTDQNNLEEGKETAVERTRRLF